MKQNQTIKQRPANSNYPKGWVFPLKRDWVCFADIPIAIGIVVAGSSVLRTKPDSYREATAQGRGTLPATLDTHNHK
jgi:hypothetical protein